MQGAGWLAGVTPLAAFVLLLASANSASTDYPAAEVWGAARELCEATGDIPETWSSVVPNEGTSLYHMAMPTRYRAEARDVFMTKVAGRTLYSVVEDRHDKRWCWTYDFEMIEVPQLSQWFDLLGPAKSERETEFTTDYRFEADNSHFSIVSQRPGYTPHMDAVGFHGLQISQFYTK